MKRENKELYEAIQFLMEKYEVAKSTHYVVKPVAWALYQTWKEFDKNDKVHR